MFAECQPQKCLLLRNCKYLDFTEFIDNVQPDIINIKNGYSFKNLWNKIFKRKIQVFVCEKKKINLIIFETT